MYERIFVAIDNSSTAQKALDEAIQLASKLGAGICIGTALDEAPVTQHGMGRFLFFVDSTRKSSFISSSFFGFAAARSFD